MSDPNHGTLAVHDAIIDLRSTLHMLRRRRWIIVLAGVVGAAVAVSMALVTTPIYNAAVELEIEPPTSSSFANLSGQRDLFSEQELDTQVRVLASEQVAERVVENLALSDSPGRLLGQLSVAPIGETRVLVVAVRDVDPERAAELAEGFANAYLEWRREDAVARLLETTATLRSRQATLTDRLDQLDALIAASDEAGQAPFLEERAQVLQSLASIETQLAVFSDEEAFVRGGGSILRHAAIPSQPIEPRPVRSLVLGLMFGVGAGVLLAIVRERLDDSISDEAAVASATAGRPVLAQVPWHEEADEDRLVALVAPAAPASEAFRTLRTNLRFAAGGTAFRSVIFTSALEAEGKTTVAANYAIAAARAGYSTVLIDADMRQPRLHAMLSLDRTTGLSRLITQQIELDAARHPTSVPGLEIITAGPTPPNPAELLGSQGMLEVLAELQAEFDLIVMDAPPVLPVADALELSSVVDATLLVVHALESKRRPVGAAAARLHRIGAHFVGTVLTAVDPRDQDVYAYGAYADQGSYGTTAQAAASATALTTASSDESLMTGERPWVN